LAQDREKTFFLLGSLAADSNHKALTALCSATIENRLTIFRGHTGAESVSIFATTTAWLISAFHDRFLGCGSEFKGA
jgi:hypothetical protein